FSACIQRPTRPTLFPYTTLFRSSNELISDILTANIDHFNDEEIYQSILTNSKKLIDEYQHARIFAIGVTTPGFVDSQLGVNNSYPKKSPLHDLAKRLKDNLQDRKSVV